MRQHLRDENLPEAVMPACSINKVLRGQKALVTGANSGIGQAVALALAHAGADVVINYVSRPEAAEAVVKEAMRCGASVYAHQADVRKEDQVQAMFKKMIQEFGTIDTNEAKREARGKFLAPILAHLEEAGLGHISEIADAEPAYTPRGCPFQAWSVGEALRLDQVVLAERAGLPHRTAAEADARTSVRLIAPKTATSRIPIAVQPKKNETVSRPRATRQRDAVTV